MAYFETPTGQRLLWKITKPAFNFFVSDRHGDNLRRQGFMVNPRLFTPGTRGDGRHSGLNTAKGVEEEHCLCLRIDKRSEVQKLLTFLEC